MSKLHNRIVPLSIIPKHIDISLLKIMVPEKNQLSRVSMAQNKTSIDELYRIFNANINAVVGKIKPILTKILDWLEEIKQDPNSERIEKDNTYLKVWKLLITAEDQRSANQFKIILDQFNTDIKVN